MPEYLAPGVYVEEIDTGSKPIEGVSTSTAGVVGLTERGPVNVPILITGYGEYQRWFGGYLNRADFPDTSPESPLRFLPHAVEGFFTNGGKRVYVVRVVEIDKASNASTMLFDRGAATSAATILLRAALPNTGTAANLPLVLVLSQGNLALNDWIRIGDGSTVDYRRLTAVPANETFLVPLALPLGRTHRAATPPTVEQFTPNSAGAAMTLVQAAQRGDDTVELTSPSATIAALVTAVGGSGALLEIGPTNQGEQRFVTQLTSLSSTNGRVRLDSPLTLSYAAGAQVQRYSIPGAASPALLDPAAGAGDSLLYLDDRKGNFDTRTDWVIIDRVDAWKRQVRRIGELRQLTLATGAPADYSAGAIVEAVNLSLSNRRVLDRAQVVGDQSIRIDDVSSLEPGQSLTVGGGPRREAVVVDSVDQATRVVTLQAALTKIKSLGDPVSDDLHSTINKAAVANDPSIEVSNIGAIVVGQSLQAGSGADQEVVIVQSIDQTNRTLTLQAPLTRKKDVGGDVVPILTLTSTAAPGSNLLVLGNRMGLQAGDVLQVGSAPDDEYVVIERLPKRAPAGVFPDAGNVILTYPLTRNHEPAATRAIRLTPAMIATVQPSSLILEQRAGSTSLLVSDGGGTGYPANSAIRVTGAAGDIYFHRVAATTPAPGTAGALTPGVLTLNEPLGNLHALGSTIAERRPLLDVVALDQGSWGNRLRISVEDESGTLATTTLKPFAGSITKVKLAATTGVEPGTVLELFDPATGIAIGANHKVDEVNRLTREVTLAAPGLDGDQQNFLAGPPVDRSLGVRSREFILTVRLLRQPEPAVPSRGESVLDVELFRSLSLDHRHSRYVHKVIGTTWASAVATTTNDDDNQPLRREDRRSKGESRYIRIRDQAAALVDTEAIRIGPELLFDLLPSGLLQPARRALEDGDDDTGSITDATYQGLDSNEPAERTGLFSLRNEEEIAIVAIPGRTSVAIQGALIDHCELMHYRFAVMDGPQPPGDSLSDVQNQRQQFDTKYAALYHPWLEIPDPYPVSLVNIPNDHIAPSGHMLGIYARTDIERGVHKAPANEVVRGIVGLKRSLNKGEQDILNPYPVNINVIRDFRLDNRGIRVYGGRVITSDPDWKYVNVRRLLIFIEHSLDRGLQWVVFEPNAEPLWARVRRSISNFLTTVWRNGALEGTTKEEAFFVKCDRTTMTQTDIDNGRLIVVIGVAPVKPAEYVIVRIGLWTAHAED